MQKDEVFELASATKPITATAVMMLVEEGKIHLTDPVYKYVPEFKNEKVRILKPGVAIRHVIGPNPTSKNNVRDYTSGSYDGNPPSDFNEVPANHDITVRDLITHTSGLMSSWSGAPVNPEGSPQQEDLTNTTLAALVPKFAAVPLDFQPGTRWAYSNWAGFDVLARIVEVASGQTFGEFLKQRILDPLGMKDTWMAPLADSRVTRFATRYEKTPQGLVKYLPEKPFIRSKTYLSGAAGLSGTAADYWRFGQMLLNGGEFNGKRLLKQSTVAEMTSNQVGDLYANSGRAEGMGFGYGLSMVVDHTVAKTPLSDGTFTWGGATGVKTSMNPKENIILDFMVAGGSGKAEQDFEATAMEALVH
jgi:CubicO group peptidase (beta-lactamase class C family)